jgi:hypothetical protein
MDDQAWPFLIGRTRTQDHRIVVIPDFLADGALLSALRISADGAPGSPDSVQIREIEASPGDRVTVIYRVNMAQAEDWGLPGEHVLTDEQGRPIVLTEGLVIGRPAREVRQDGITQEDLDQARSLVVPAYREFWAEGRDYVRQAARSFPLAVSGQPVTVSPGSSHIPSVRARPAASRTPVGVSPHGAEPAEDRTDAVVTHMPAGAGATAPALMGGHRSRKRTAPLVAAGVAVVAIVIAALLAARLLRGSGTAGPTSDPARTMATLCSALQSGDPARGYAVTTSAYQHETAEQKFAAELLPLGKTAAAHCSYLLKSNPGPTTANATMTVSEGSQAHSWQVALSRVTGGNWQVSTIR